MKLASAFNFATGALVAASAIPGNKVNTPSNQLQHADQSSGLAKRERLRFDKGCRARLMESLNPAAIYTVANVDENFCSRWLAEAVENCPKTKTLLPSENFSKAWMIPNQFLTFTLDPALLGWVSSEGPTNKSSADCTVNQFNKVIGEFREDPSYKVNLGLYIFVCIGALVAVGGAVGAAYVFWPKKSPANDESATELERR